MITRARLILPGDFLDGAGQVGLRLQLLIAPPGKQEGAIVFRPLNLLFVALTTCLAWQRLE